MIRPIAFAQAKNAETGVKTLLGSRPSFEDGLPACRSEASKVGPAMLDLRSFAPAGRGLDQTGGVWTDTLGFGLQPFMGPTGIAAMSAWHVVADRGVSSLLLGSGTARVEDPA